ncbi:MAG: hydrogenase formation protein HypD [Desulfobacterota bacterium]|jgi:hydrogenase expression/formation protein HypD|nr:hydrogenase formation protein HypD [Thermodesulfobacteriota bacterium]
MPLKHLSEYRDPGLARQLIAAIRSASRKPARFMEVCGTHTVAIFRSGIRQVIPPHLQLISGPGCPVCVTATEDIDQAVKLAKIPGVLITTFGDLIRVPGSHSSLQQERAGGADVRIVYSTFDALKLAREHPEKKVVFLAIGFETTAPTIAAAILEAARTELPNFYILTAHKLLPPALGALLGLGELNLQGFIYPGHVTTIIGTAAYEEVARRQGIPGVVCGFEPVDILETILLLVEQVEKGEARVEIQYKRGATAQGNIKAREILNQVFEPCAAVWRGLGSIPESGLTLRSDFRRFAAEEVFDLQVPPAQDHPGCACGEVLRGIKSPPDCALFRKACTPDRPIGPCMVSTEGTCAAYFKYHD